MLSPRRVCLLPGREGGPADRGRGGEGEVYCPSSEPGGKAAREAIKKTPMMGHF